MKIITKTPLALLCIAFTPFVLKTSAQKPEVGINIAGSKVAVQKNVHLSSDGFYENKGQIVTPDGKLNPEVKYLMSSPGFNVQLRSTGFSYDTYTDTPLAADTEQQFSPIVSRFKKTKKYTRNYHRVDIDLVGCNASAELISEDKSDKYYNYFTSGTPKGGVSQVHTYQKVTYKNIYPNIDLEFSSSHNNKTNIPVEYQFVVHPGGNPADIKLQYKGANNVSLENNKLMVNVTAGSFEENIPSSYMRDTKEQVNVKYAALGNNTFGFSIPELPLLEGGEALIIDPTPDLLWGTYYGGTDDDYVYRTTLFGGNIYVTGQTSSTTGIATAGAYKTTNAGGVADVFVAEFNATGSSLLWGTYYGGTGDDEVFGLAVDVSGNVYIAGETSSTSGIATVGAHQTTYGGGSYDCFIAAFNPTGTSLLWGTYYGGTSEDYINDMVMDGSGNLYVTGVSSSAGLATSGAYKTTHGSADAIVAKFNSSGVLQWGTYYGGTSIDYGFAIAVNASGNAYICGFTSSSSSIATSGEYKTVRPSPDAGFVAEFNLTGTALVWGTYYGGTLITEPYDMVLDGSNNVYFTGSTSCTTGIATSGTYQTSLVSVQDIFIAELNSTGTALNWGTYYGGSPSDGGYAIVLDANNNVYVTGYTDANSGIATPGAYQTTAAHGGSCFVSKFNSTGTSLLWGTYYGEGEGLALAVDAFSNVYAGGSIGSSSGIATTGAYQTTEGDTNGTGFLAKFGILVNISQTNMHCNGGTDGSATASADGGISPYTYSWSNGTSTVSTSNATGTTLSAGSYTVTITDITGAGATASVTISQPSALIYVSAGVYSNVTCNGLSNGRASANPVGGVSPYTYTWTNGSTIQTPSNFSAGSYTVIVADSCGKAVSASITITQPTVLSATATVTSNVTCYNGNNGSAISSPTGGGAPYTYLWSDATSATTASVSNLTAGSYTVTVSDTSGCSATASVSITMPTQFQYITAGTISNVSCNGSSTGHITVTGIGGNLPYTYSWNGAAGPVSTMQSPNTMAAGSYTVTVTDNCGVSHTATATVTQPAVMQDSVSAQTNTSCGGGNGGSATIGASGGTYPYQYLWSNGASQATASALSAGSYSVVITDQHGCTNSVTGITITQPNPLTLNLSTISYPLCHAETTGAASVTEIGGTAPYTYTWSPAASTTNTAMNIAAGSYTVSVKDAHRCTASLVVVITQPAAIHDSVVKALTVNVACKNGSIGSATIGVKYGTAPYTYVWGATTYYTSTVTGLSAGTYSVTIEDANGCQSTVASLTITQPAMVQLDSVSLLVNTACYGGDGGVVSIGTRGGVSPYTYGWSDGKTGYNITGLTAGTYSVIITDKAGCSNSISSITITQPSAPVSSTINTDCTGNDMATVTIGGSGGTPGYSYLWSNGKTTTSLNVANGTYTVKVSDSRGCSATNSVMVLCDAAVVLRGHVVSDSNIAGCCGDGTLTNINLYPNPSSGQFTIQLSGVSGQWSVEVYSVLGQKVYSQSTIHQAQTTINLSNQPNGIYLIRILDSIGTLVGEKKVVKTN